MNSQRPVLLVTGAASGLGHALTQTFATAGWCVFAGLHRQPAAHPCPGVRYLPLDVTQPNQITTALAHIQSEAGRLDLLINNAGITADGLLLHTTAADWDQVLDVNLRGAARLAAACLPLLLTSPPGQILNVASHAAHGAAGQAAYSSAKAGLIAFTQSLARELGPQGVRVNAILPGLLPTAMTAQLPAARLADLVAGNVLGGLNDLGEVSRFLLHLASTRQISGQVFALDSRIRTWV